jgi:hypothetical protein
MTEEIVGEEELTLCFCSLEDQILVYYARSSSKEPEKAKIT